MSWGSLAKEEVDQVLYLAGHAIAIETHPEDAHAGDSRDLGLDGFSDLKIQWQKEARREVMSTRPRLCDELLDQLAQFRARLNSDQIRILGKVWAAVMPATSNAIKFALSPATKEQEALVQEMAKKFNELKKEEIGR